MLVSITENKFLDFPRYLLRNSVYPNICLGDRKGKMPVCPLVSVFPMGQIWPHGDLMTMSVKRVLVTY